MISKPLTYFFILALCKEALFSDEDNRIEAEVDSDDADGGLTVDDLKNELLNEENLKNLGGAISNFMQSDGGKQIGSMIMNGLKDGGGNVIMNQLLQGVGNLMQQQTSVGDAKRGDSGSLGAGMGGLSPELMGSLLNMMMQAKSGDPSGGGVDFNSIMQMLMSFNAQDSPMGYMNLIPTIMQMMTNSFTGPEAQKRELKHAEHTGMFPPIIEKLHIFVDHFVNSEMGAALMESTGASKALKMFSDERGNFSYPKFVEMFENHSFRKHWISIATKRVANFVSYFADPYTQKKFMTTFTLFVNNFLKGQGVPKAALLDPTLPNESLTALANYLSKKFLGQKIDSKHS
ncbi:hypothetical protein AMK59_6652 [Oryctes borbonicus]|uniref:Uncharacterized protein n=1 Tax=Oryctes borbonicus TaxID=1629725 RepID=A0A0T6AX79_9SCAR|nr:hypothetical protein AMK59_6652 [Oryctes borbonicus]